MKQHWRLELAEARVLIEAATARAREIGVPETVAVVDDGGHLIALERMDGARITGPEIAIAKAFYRSRTQAIDPPL